MGFDDFAKNLARLDRLQTYVGVDGGLYVPVTKELTNKLVLAGPMLENEGASGVSELVDCHP
jgi:hypothetical protein